MVFLYNLLDLKRTIWEGPELGPGKHTIVFDYKVDEPGLGKSGTVVLTVDGKEVDRESMEHGTPVRVSMPTFRFTGTIDRLHFKLAEPPVAAR